MYRKKDQDIDFLFKKNERITYKSKTKKK